MRFSRSSPTYLHGEYLQGVEKVKNGTIVDGKRIGGDFSPIAAQRATFEKRVTVGVEERSSVRDETKILILNAAMHGTKRCEQPAPCVMSASRTSSPM